MKNSFKEKIRLIRWLHCCILWIIKQKKYWLLHLMKFVSTSNEVKRSNVILKGYNDSAYKINIESYLSNYTTTSVVSYIPKKSFSDDTCRLRQVEHDRHVQPSDQLMLAKSNLQEIEKHQLPDHNDVSFHDHCRQHTARREWLTMSLLRLLQWRTFLRCISHHASKIIQKAKSLR